MEEKIKRLEVLLYNAISLLVEKSHIYTDWIYDELGTTPTELQQYGIDIEEFEGEE